MVKTYIVPMDFDVRSTVGLDEPAHASASVDGWNLPQGSSFDIPFDEVSATGGLVSVQQEFATGALDEYADLIGDWKPAEERAEARAVEVQAEVEGEIASTPVGQIEEMEVEKVVEPEQQQEQQPVQPPAKRDRICRMISSVKDDIRSIDQTIADLSAELKQLKKDRGNKLERLLELAEELDNPGDDVEGDGDGESYEESDDDLLSSVGQPGEEQSAAASDYNPWEQWQQGETIPVVRVLVDTQGIDQGMALQVFDIEPPAESEDGSIDHLAGSVTAFLPNSRETIVMSKRECGPMVHWIKEAEVGRRIGERPKVAESGKAKSEMASGDWQSIPVSKLKLPRSLEAILIEENGIKTIGDIAGWSSAGKLLTDLKKVGEAKAEKIQEALDAFWARGGA